MNLLSYQPGTIFTGKQIRDWAKKNIENSDKMKRKSAEHILSHYWRIRNDAQYQIYIDHRSENPSSDRVIHLESVKSVYKK